MPFWLVSTKVLASVKGDMYNENQYHYSEFKRVGEIKLDRVPFDAKSNLDNDMLNGILPFDYSNVRKFEYPYLAGFYAEVFDENQIKETIRDISIKKLTSTIPNYVEGEFSKIEKVNFFADDFKYEYCINDSNYNVSGKYPVNKYNCFMLYFLDFVLSILLCCLISIIDQSLGISLGLAVFLILLPLIDHKIKEHDKIKVRKSNLEYILEDSFKIISE